MKTLKEIILEKLSEVSNEETIIAEAIDTVIGFDINVGIDKMREDFDKIKTEVIKFAKETGDSHETNDSNEDTFELVINYDFSDSKLQPGLLKHTMEKSKEQNVKTLKELGADSVETESFGV